VMCLELFFAVNICSVTEMGMSKAPDLVTSLSAWLFIEKANF